MPTNPVMVLEPHRISDDRGWFMEVYSERAFAERGIAMRFVQDNHSFSGPKGVLRGLHFQTPPFAQAKLVRCVRGAIFDVAVDLRKGSPTWGKWVSAELSSDNGRQLFIPVGFGHGFLTLTPDAEVTYKVSAPYSRDHDGGIRHDDPAIGVAWPLADGDRPIVSAKDAALPHLTGWDSPFEYDGRPLRSLAEK
jgi:dTDP-4-dehydrorhamnose 3,5-epimerase